MKIYSIFIVSPLLLGLFAILTHNYQEQFNQINKAYDDGVAVNLSEDMDDSVLADVLAENYIEDSKDVEFAVRFLKAKLKENGPLSALSDLQKRAWKVPVNDEVLAKYDLSLGDMGESMAARTENMRQTDSPEAEGLESELEIDDAYSGRMSALVCVRSADESSIVSKIKSMLGREDYVAGVVVRLTVYGWDGLAHSPVTERYYAKTNSDGVATFTGLDPEKSYSLLPIKDGKEYGSEKGTVGGSLAQCGDDNVMISKFYEDDLCVPLFDNQLLSQIKSEELITVRTPSMFLRQMWIYVGVFMAVWWLLSLIIRRKRKDADMWLVALLMLITGVSLCNMFSLNAPLVDKLIGVDMAQGVIVGVSFMCLLQWLDVVKLYQEQTKSGFDVPMSCFKWVFKPFRRKVRFLTEKMTDKNVGVVAKLLAVVLVVVCLPLLLLDLIRLTALSDNVERGLAKLPKGSGYLLLALFLTLLLLTPLGKAVGGMRVNLDLGFVFQPSEIAKYLIVLFMAAFFCTKAQSIVKYSERGNAGLFGAKIKMMTMLILGLGFLMALYLVLGDMGPALVLAFTFIILYSIIKSKVDLEGVVEERKLSRILTCDVAMLLYGVVSFLALLYFGGKLLSLLWFVVWIVFGLFRKQIFESAILFNLVITAFVFGGDIMGSFSSLESVAERLDSRTEMCTNTWGTLPLDGAEEDAGSNAQVANGLWAISSGGVFGQGFGKSLPSLIPAFHTDMILESMGEQIGWIGLLALFVVLAVILRKVVVVGYRSTHPFAFYLCLGVTIVTAVQFIIISLGSTGIIPLTGVTVPLLSYGRVSMIINLLAFGFVLSIMSHSAQSNEEATELGQLKRREMRKYEYSVSILSWMYCLLTVVVASVFFYYGVVARDKTLIRPVYVHTANGIPVVEYNPRIALLTERMKAGNIYDRNGVLLATSDVDELKKDKAVYESLGLEYNTLIPQKRDYPFGEHLYFMLGDANSKLFFGSDAGSRYPRGYMAESYHLSDLRGYDNVKRDSKGESKTITLHSDRYAPGRYYEPTYKRTEEVTIRDYSALLPFLKSGIYGSKVERYNNRESLPWESDMVQPQDVKLTIDAVLQTRLQQELEQYMSQNYSAKKYNKTRASVVVLDARDGDLLASANYPKADYDVLREKASENYYSDNYTPSSFKPYVLEDAGLLYATQPGSSAKVMSAIAGLHKLGIGTATTKKYYVHSSQKTGLEPDGWVDMQKAIVESSNCFFINLVNDYELYEPLSEIYSAVGASMYGQRAYSLGSKPEDDAQWRSLVTDRADEAIKVYEKYAEQNSKEKMDKHEAWLWAWGQGDLTASPLAMARVASAVVNGGVMPQTRYTLKDKKTGVELLDEEMADVLAKYMIEEAKDKTFKGEVVGGKTGTAERTWWKSKKQSEDLNDAWFICFIKRENQTPLAVTVRIERLEDGEMSGHAVRMTKNLVGGVLKECGLITEWNN